MLKKVLLPITIGAYGYDTYEGGGKINRSARAIYCGFCTFIEYKYMLGREDQTISQVHKRVAERWLWAVKENGGLYTKLAQAVAAMNHVLPPEYLNTLQVVQDRAPTVGPLEVETVLMEEFGKTSRELFAYFEPEAVASASVAQVHRATLHDGTKVAVKIQKPDIPKQIEADLFMYQGLAYFVEKAFSIPILWSIPYTCAQLRQETDFRIEAENSKIAEQNIDPTIKDKISIPKVYDDYSSRRVLTCEWIDGVKVTDVKAIREMGLNTSEIMDVIIKFFSHQLFVSGHLHADPHPGNILIRVRPDSKKKKKIDVVIIDHGLYCHEPEAFRKSYALLWRGIVTGNASVVREVAESWGIHDHELFASFQLFRPYKPGRQAPITTGTVSKAEMLQLQQNAKERVIKMLSDSSLVPPELSLVGRHLNLVRSLNKAYNSPVNRPRIMAVYANRGLNKESGLFVDARFNFHVFLIEFLYRATQLWQNVKLKLTGVNNGGFEELLDKQMEKQIEQNLGFKLPDNFGKDGTG